MRHQKISTNASNWSGKQTQATLYDNNGTLTLEHNGHTFEVKTHSRVCPEDFGGFYTLQLFHEGHAVVTATKWGNDQKWMAYNGASLSDYSITKESRCPLEAAIKVLSNIW